jgi:Protein of unknown function (DUF1572)
MEPSKNSGPIASALAIFKQYKTLGEKALNQINPNQFDWKPDSESNSIFIIIKHLNGNMLSRWTDFLTTDGEKEWRNRDTEFEEQNLTKQQLLDHWQKGWDCLFNALNSLTGEDLLKTIYIRSEGLLVIDAINRQMAHYPYHVGQIVYLARIIKNEHWQNLSIAKGHSDPFNAQMKSSP